MNTFTVLLDLDTDPYINKLAELDPQVLATMINAVDHPKWDKAMRDPHADSYGTACQHEIDTLKTRKV